MCVTFSWRGSGWQSGKSAARGGSSLEVTKRQESVKMRCGWRLVTEMMGGRDLRARVIKVRCAVGELEIRELSLLLMLVLSCFCLVLYPRLFGRG